MKSFSNHIAEKAEIEKVPLVKINAIFYMVIVITIFNFIGLLTFLDVAFEVYDKVAGIGMDIHVVEKTA